MNYNRKVEAFDYSKSHGILTVVFNDGSYEIRRNVWDVFKAQLMLVSLS